MDERPPGGTPQRLPGSEPHTVYVGRIREDLTSDRGLLLMGRSRKKRAPRCAATNKGEIARDFGSQHM